MIKNSIKIILILVSVAMAFAGVVIWSAQEKDVLKEDTVIEISGETNKTLKAELAGFYPGGEKEYVISLSGDSASEYDITLTFRDDEDTESGDLENYLTVKITTEEITIEKTLKELLQGETLALGKTSDGIKIVYAMPQEIGNESQGTTADFYIDFTAKNDK